MVVVFVAIFSACNAKAQDCSYWYAAVGVDGVKYRGDEIDEKNPKKIIEGIECLIRLEGDKTNGAFSGATHFEVSQIFPRATVEICALYYISKLFYEKYDHSDGVALQDIKTRGFNSDESVRKAYESYRKWFEKVKEIGLEEARKQKLDPLEGSGVQWY